jgi:hypothetical protein
MEALYSTAPTLESIRESVVAFYAGTPMTLAPVDANRWAIVRDSDGKVLEGVRIVRQRGRFRFEGI